MRAGRDFKGRLFRFFELVKNFCSDANAVVASVVLGWAKLRAKGSIATFAELFSNFVFLGGAVLESCVESPAKTTFGTSTTAGSKPFYLGHIALVSV